jgi:hypothetical protein
MTEEKDPTGRADTCRFLAAGAARLLWLRVRQGQLGGAIPQLESALQGTEWVMIESNSILEFIHPALYLVVLDSSRQDFKESARMHLDRADAFVPIKPRLDPGAWAGLDPGVWHNKPQFPVAPGKYFSAELCRFARMKLRLAENESNRQLMSCNTGRKE